MISLENFGAPPEYYSIDKLAYACNWTLKKYGWETQKEDRKSASFTKKGPGRKHRQGATRSRYPSPEPTMQKPEEYPRLDRVGAFDFWAASQGALV